jgi:hypothetical protein
MKGLLFAAMLAATPAWAGAPRCFLYGIMTPKIENKAKTSLSDWIRLHFDVANPDDKAKCEQMMESYCVHNVKEKDYSPSRLKGSWKPDVDKTEEAAYTFSEKCKLQSD